MKDKICSCPLHTVNGSLVRAYLDQACEVHGQRAMNTSEYHERVGRLLDAAMSWVRSDTVSPSAKTIVDEYNSLQR